MASLKEKIAYAMGDAAAGGIVWKVMSIAFPLFFTNVFGLSFADAAVLMLIARMFDVVTDPLMGSLADRTVTFRYVSSMAYLWRYSFWIDFRLVALYARLRTCGQAHLRLYLVSPDDGCLYDGECAIRFAPGCDDRG